MMESVLGLSYYNSFCGFSLRGKIEDVSVGIRAILDLRMRPLVPNTSVEAKHSISSRSHSY